jgi:hypothetical protein
VLNQPGLVDCSTDRPFTTIQLICGTFGRWGHSVEGKARCECVNVSERLDCSPLGGLPRCDYLHAPGINQTDVIKEQQHAASPCLESVQSECRAEHLVPDDTGSPSCQACLHEAWPRDGACFK